MDGGSPSNQEEGGGRQRWLRALGSLATVGAAGYLVWRERHQLDAIEDVSPVGIIGIVALQLVYLVFQSERFRVTFATYARTLVDFWGWSEIFVRSRLYNLVASQAGNIYRGAALKSRYGGSVGVYLAALTGHTWFSTAVSLVLAVLLGLFTRLGDTSTLPAPTLAVTALVTVVWVATPQLLRSASGRLPARVQDRGFVHKARLGLDAITTSFRDRRFTVLVLTNGLGGFLAGAAIFQLSYSQVGVNSSLAAAATTLAFFQVLNVVILTPGNLGVQELGVAGLAAAFGYTPESGVLVSVIIRLSGIAALLIAGVAIGVRQMVNSRRGAIDSREPHR